MISPWIGPFYAKSIASLTICHYVLTHTRVSSDDCLDHRIPTNYVTKVILGMLAELVFRGFCIGSMTYILPQLGEYAGDLYGYYAEPPKDQACQVSLHCRDLLRFGATNRHQNMLIRVNTLYWNPHIIVSFLPNIWKLGKIFMFAHKITLSLMNIAFYYTTLKCNIFFFCQAKNLS